MADYKNLVEMQEDSCRKFKDREMYGNKGPNGYEYITYGQFAEWVDQFRGGLASLGVGKGDKVGVISKNSVQWAVGAYATYGLEAYFVPMYEDQLPKDWSFIIGDSGAKVVLVSTTEIFEKAKPLVDEIENLQHLINLEGPASDPNTFEGMLKIGKEKPIMSRQPETSEPMGLIYTSGTTGNPKGVILSHANILSNVNSIQELLDINETDRSLSFLPWAHIFGQVAELHGLIISGYSAGFAEGPTKIVENLAEVRPSLLYSVPRVFNKIYERVNDQIKEKGGLAKYLFTNGMTAASKLKKGESLSLWESVLLGLARKIVFKKIRDRFGGKLRYAISGAAALSVEVANFIDNLDILVYEGYGLSETSPMVTINSKLGRKIGTVGKVIPNVRVVIDKSVMGNDSPDGEIVVYGPNVMQGYHNLPDATKEVITDDGGFRTGDLGRFDEEKFLKITGRIKEQYKLENGKYVAPSPLEEKLQLSPYINQAMLYGDNKLYNVALVVPEMEHLKKFAESAGINASSLDLLKEPKIRELIGEELKKYADAFKHYEIPKNFAFVDEEWTPENGMLTPTMKLKRRIVVDRYKNVIEGLYA